MRRLDFVRWSLGLAMSPTYEQIRRVIDSLSRDEQIRLMSELAEHLETNRARESRTSILELQGLGKGIWQDVDAQEYVDRERAAWNG